MSVTAISRDQGVNISIVRLTAANTLAEVATANYLTAQAANIAVVNSGTWNWLSNDMVLVSASDGEKFFTVSSDFTTLVLYSTAGDGAVTLPVVSGNFTVFDGTLGALKDAGYAPSDATKTIVSMASGATTANALAVFADTAGTVKNASTTSTLGQSLSVTGAVTASTILQGVNLKYGATPVAQVDPASCTITAAAGASNTATVTIQLKDGSGTNMARIIPFKVYASSAADGLTLASAASTGFSVASGGLSLNNGAAITTQINAISSATGGCVLSLLDSAKQTSYLVLVLANGTKISAQLSAGSYG